MLISNPKRWVEERILFVNCDKQLTFKKKQLQIFQFWFVSSPFIVQNKTLISFYWVFYYGLFVYTIKWK